MQLSKSALGISLIFFILIHSNIAAKNQLVDVLDKIYDSDSRSPVVAVFYKKNLNVDLDVDPRNDEEEEPDIDALEPPHDQNAYMLYHILRTAQENEAIDEEASEKLEKTKDILRQALRIRCKRLDACVQLCPPPKKYLCKIQCQEIHDDYNVCEPRPKPKKCRPNSPKCGKTMPPYWLLLKK